MDKTSRVQNKACIRCGTCCLLCTCSYGEESPETGLCKHLSFSKDKTATCGIYDEIRKSSSMFGAGCTLRRNPKLYRGLKKDIDDLRQIEDDG